MVIKVSEHRKGETFAGYKKSVGGRMFYFGKNTDKPAAERIAAALMMAWNTLKSQGAMWTDEAITAALKLGGATPRPRAIEAARIDDKPKEATVSLYVAINLYNAHLEAQATARQLSTAHFHRTRHALQWSKAYIKDTAVAAIDFDAIARIVNTFTSRPKSERFGRPISPCTVHQVLNAYRSLMTYLEDTGRWTCPNWHKAFKVKRTAMYTRQERAEQGEGVETFTVPELAAIYRATKKNPAWRLLLLAGINFGATQMETASYLKASFRLRDNPPRLVHARNKTGVQGQWVLWPETAAAVTKRLDATPNNPDGLAFLTSDGKPLVWYNANNKIDSVTQAWTRLVAKARKTMPDLRPLSYKYLRKTGATMIMQLAGLEVAQQYLAHVPASIAERHYLARDFSKLDAALHQMRAHLQPMFDADSLPDVKGPRRKAATANA